ncbi:hypothetical protein ABIA24_000916 [Sinorhizobium fredii]|uniref:hypothetical protein n=1 Tax=Rhizobium fredii TaxID=380 RepID=UPI00351849AB
MFRLLTLTALMAATCYEAHADCSETLVVSVHQSGSSASSDYRLSQFVSESQYNEMKHSAGAEANIYGVPVGANYSDYQRASRNMIRKSGESITRVQADNVFWTGLEGNALDAYKTCILAGRYGLFLYPRSATESEVELVLDYRPTPPAADALKLDWVGRPSPDLPDSIDPNSSIPIILNRPADGDEYLLAVKGGSLSAPAVTVTSYPYPPQPFEPEWKEVRTKLLGGKVNLPDGYEMRDIQYAHVGSSPHTHSFTFDLWGPEGRIRSGLQYVGDNSQPWQESAPINVGGHVFKYGFSNWNDGVGKLHYSWL